MGSNGVEIHRLVLNVVRMKTQANGQEMIGAIIEHENLLTTLQGKKHRKERHAAAETAASTCCRKGVTWKMIQRSLAAVLLEKDRALKTGCFKSKPSCFFQKHANPLRLLFHTQ